MKRILILALCVMLALACGAALAEETASEARVDPCVRTRFDKSVDAGALIPHGEEVGYEFTDCGVLISGKCADVNASSLTLRGLYDFGQPGDGAVGVAWDRLFPVTDADGVKWCVVECERHFESLMPITESFKFLQSKGRC